jgi:hypothetical protein
MENILNNNINEQEEDELGLLGNDNDELIQTKPSLNLSNFPPCLKKFKFLDGSNENYLIYQSKQFNNATIKLYKSKNNVDGIFKILNGDKKGMVGTYSCTNTGKLFFKISKTNQITPQKNKSKEVLRGRNVNFDENDILNGQFLKLGDKGNIVKELQKLLKQRSQDYNDSSFSKVSNDDTFSGIFDKTTEKAVKNFQNLTSLRTDGLVGNKTWNELKRDIELKESIDIYQKIKTLLF